MSFLSRLFGKKQPPAGVWPNDAAWGALKNNVSVETEEGRFHLSTVACGDLMLPSGRLVACDPFVFLEPANTPHIEAPRGKFPVVVTLADVSRDQSGGHIREAYASILFSDMTAEAYRKALPLAKQGAPRRELKGDEFVGFPVDAGTACFVDESVVGPCMPDPKTWGDDVFENEREDCWFRRMDDPAHIRAGIANITLPLAKNGENLILFHSGYGDGVYPVVGSFDSSDRLIAAHIDFGVVSSW